MRQYRGNRVDNGEEVKGWYVEIEGAHYIVDNTVSHTWLEEDCYEVQGLLEVDPATVGQQTPYKDKNNKFIFEGDKLIDDVGDIGIVRFGELPLGKSGDCVCTYQAIYVECLGQLGRAPTYECVEIGDWMEIVGNIHDKPEEDK